MVDWGRPGDGGVVGELAGQQIGAAWYRLYESPEPEWGVVNETTPELAIAVVEGARGKGYGGRILDAAIHEAVREGHHAMSLRVSKGRRGNNFTLSPERVRPRRHRAVAALEVVVS